MTKLIDLTNRKIGRLRVLGRHEGHSAAGNALWDCACDCGNLTVVDGYRLRSGDCQSCGCLRRESARENFMSNAKIKANMGRVENLYTDERINYSAINVSKRNKSGVIGVSYNESNGKWFARLMKDKHYLLLKSFPTFEEAVDARREAEKKFLMTK